MDQVIIITMSMNNAYFSCFTQKTNNHSCELMVSAGTGDRVGMLGCMVRPSCNDVERVRGVEGCRDSGRGLWVCCTDAV